MIFPLKELNDQIQKLTHKDSLMSIWGEHGVGKTSISLQTAFYNCALSNLVIFIYTKPNIPLKMLKRISQKFIEKDLSDFLLYKILTFSELFDFILDLEQIIAKVQKNRKKGKMLVIVDSIINLYQIELRKNSKNKNVILNYKLNQILATLNYLKNNYPVDIIIVNNYRIIRQDNQTIEVQGGGKVMKYWLDFSIKIERHKKLNYRRFTLTNRSDIKESSIISRLTKFGFE